MPFLNHVSPTLVRGVASLVFAVVIVSCGGGAEPAGQGIFVDVVPSQVDVAPNGTVSFAAAVTGTVDTSVTWSVAETGGGMVDATGVYTAPATTGQYHVRAASRANSAVVGEATVTVTQAPALSVSVNPSSTMVVVNGSATFSATVYNAADPSVTWSLQETSGCGSITQGGVFTAPAAPATCHVVAASVEDPSKRGIATVAIAAAGGGSGVLRTQGRYLLDTCGNQLVIRGVEGSVGEGMQVGGTFAGYIDQIAATGANAVRLLPDQAPGQSTARASVIEGMIARAAGHGMVVYLSVYDNRYNDFVPWDVIQAFWSRQDIKDVVNRYRKWMILDGVQEIDAGDCVAWRDEAIRRLTWLRGQGYDLPTTVISAFRGRRLDCAVQEGAAVVAADPLHQVIIGVQMYWGTDWWIETQGTVVQGIETAAQQSFPIQAGFDYVSDGGGTYVDYAGGMTAAEANGIGWLWWDYYNPFYLQQSLSLDGYSGPGHLQTPFGEEVVRTHPASIRNSSRKACGL